MASKYSPLTIALISTGTLLLSYSTRRWRAEHLTALDDASCSNDFFLSSSRDPTSKCSKLNSKNTTESKDRLSLKRKSSMVSSTVLVSPNKSTASPKRELKTLLNTIQRAGLFGVFEPSDSTQTKLSYIRKWHIDHEYSGNVIVRDLREPLFYHDSINGYDQKQQEEKSKEEMEARRECYFIYYEPNHSGGLHLEIFIRGTSKLTDLTSSIQAMFLYDADLECNLHYGFRKHADFIIKDLKSILPQNLNNSIELCGHSMGGSVALIVAMKLRTLGYNVNRVTTIGSPKICDAPQIVENKLPVDTLRVEHERDFVTFLPPHGKHVGNKLWFVNDYHDTSLTKIHGIKTEKNSNGDPVHVSKRGNAQREKNEIIDEHNLHKHKKDTANAKYLASKDIHSHHRWVDSILINLDFWNLFQTTITKHRIPSYVQQLERLIMEMEQNSTENVDNDVTVAAYSNEIKDKQK